MWSGAATKSLWINSSLMVLTAPFCNRVGGHKYPYTYNSKKNAIDIPIVARVSYTLKWLELQLSYKQGTCNLMNTSGVGKVTSRNIQFSVFMPIFK